MIHAAAAPDDATAPDAVCFLMKSATEMVLPVFPSCQDPVSELRCLRPPVPVSTAAADGAGSGGRHGGEGVGE